VSVAARRVRSIRLAAPALVTERRADGVLYLRSSQPLPAYPRALTERLEYWAEQAPDRLFFAQRDAGGGWRRITYAQMRSRARRVASALLGRGLSAERPLAVLSGNDIEHAVLELAAMYIGVPYAPVSPAYSLVSSDFAQLRRVIELTTPG
jgi:feruloyl-CoA synthase